MEKKENEFVLKKKHTLKVRVLKVLKSLGAYIFGECLFWEIELSRIKKKESEKLAGLIPLSAQSERSKCSMKTKCTTNIKKILWNKYADFGLFTEIINLSCFPKVVGALTS